MHKICLVLLASLFCIQLHAAEGDTTFVDSHTDTHLSWYNNYDRWTAFPPASKQFRKIYLDYTLGCPSSGCSQWDYTTKVEILHRNGQIDSNISSVDTLSTNPLVLDTNWNVFDVRIPIEIARVITPYAGVYSNSWKFTWRFDVTEYAPLLKDSVEIRAFFGGYQDGFTVSLDFVLIEGIPARNPIRVENIWRSGAGGYNYGIAADPIEAKLTNKTVNLNADEHSALVKITTSGHGFGNSTGGNPENCAEFCEKNYQVKVNGSLAFQESMWRSDCSDNPIIGQGGTWILNRANWCPGGKATTQTHDLSPFVNPAASFDIDLDLDPYTYVDGAGFNPNFIIDASLITLGPPNFQLDAEISGIRKPNMHDEFGKFNPICGQPEVKITNGGALRLNSVDIAYRVEGGNTCWYTWTGNLAIGESEWVTLPAFDWSGMTDQVFTAEVSWPNNWNDEYEANNSMSSRFELVPDYDNGSIIELRTNNHADENSWTVTDENGIVVAESPSLSPNTTYKDTLDLTNGCYKFELVDVDPTWMGNKGGDGLSLWFNNHPDFLPSSEFEGNGGIRFREPDNSIIRTFDPDFGARLVHYFTVGHRLGEGPGRAPCTEPEHPITGIGSNENTITAAQIVPNPTSGKFQIFVEEPNRIQSIAIRSISGKLILHEPWNLSSNMRSLDLSDQTDGIYLIELQTSSGIQVVKLNLQR